MLTVNDETTLRQALFELQESPAWRRIEDLVMSLASADPVERSGVVVEAITKRLYDRIHPPREAAGQVHLRG